MKPQLKVWAPAIIVASLWQPLQGGNPPAREASADCPSHKMVPERADVAPVLLRGRDLVGLEVRNPDQEALGRIQDLVVNASTGELVAVQVDSGGVLGVGARRVLVPWAAFRYDPKQQRLQLDATLERLNGAPELEFQRWAEGNVHGVLAESFRYFQIPATLRNGTAVGGGCSTTEPPCPDAAPMSRTLPRGKADPDPEATRIREQDAEITDLIRKEIQAEAWLSQWGRSVKVMTVQGRVTLRGLVSCEAERSRIETIAGTVVKRDAVDNLLQVRPVSY